MVMFKDADVNILVEGLSSKEKSEEIKTFSLTTQLEVFVRDLLTVPVNNQSPSNPANSKKGESK
ncbi:MAG: hypothetical protein GF311_22460 [Candidatus Lokiarchaeota archaeon]|nr:hypothetical protein [Candidatus Lokiarchaeota archaeon]